MLSLEEFTRRRNAGESYDDLLSEARGKSFAMDVAQQRERTARSMEAGMNAGITPNGASSVGAKDSLVGRIKSSARTEGYAGYGDRFQAINDLANIYRQDGAPVSGWERAKGLLSSGVDALTSGLQYASARGVRAIDDFADNLQRKWTGGYVTGTTETDDVLHQLAEEAASADDRFRSYIFGRKPKK